MEIKVISKETIQPSTPTPQEDRTFKLSSFDVLHRNTYFPLILFYPKITNPSYNVSYQLKKSLSETLTIFYPLAGRKNDVASVACNDEGALYYEATVNTSISKFLNPPKLESLNRLLPCEPYKILPQEDGELLPPLAIQVTTFECGGVTVGVCNLHALMDACSSTVVLRTWSAICRERREEIVWPDFDTAFALFPPRAMSGVRGGLLSSSSNTKIEAKCTIRRFVFKDEAINTLRTEANDDNDDDKDGDKTSTNPTRYEALSCFISMHMMHAYRNQATTAVVLHIVDVRRRIGHPFSSNSMGNLLWPAMIPYDTVSMNTNTNTDLKDLVRIMRRKMRSINRDLFLRMQADPEFLLSDECGELLLEGIEKKRPVAFVFSSWCNLGLNELDFGWGKPVWMGFRGGTQNTIPNTVVLIDTEQGIEAWITMPEECMAVLEKDVEFLTFALLNPTVSSSNM